MKNYLFYISLLLVALCSCSKEQDHYFIAVKSGNVNFTALNITVSQDSIDYASSIQYGQSDYYHNGFDNWEDRVPTQYFTLTWYYNYGDNFRDYPYTSQIDLSGVNRLWIGGNNTITLRFHPSCPEEKSAEFTFPDGSKTILTRENPDYEWYLGPGQVRILNNISGYRLETPIYAISRFEKDGYQYVNSGFIILTNEYSPTDDSMLYYDPALDCWMRGGWLNN